MKQLKLILLALMAIPGIIVNAQNNQVKPAMLGSKISDFTLPVYQGGQFSMQDLRGKNVLFIVSRGQYAPSKWCTICLYQYAEFAQLELTQKIREKYNLEIVFLMPYNKDTLKIWEKEFPSQMATVEKWKNPGNVDSLTRKQKDWMEFTRANYPTSFDFKGKKVPLPLPVLADENQEVSKGLDLYREEWNGSKAIQDIPAAIIIDKDGIVRFKYISQNTMDRPTSAYLLNYIEKML